MPPSYFIGITLPTAISNQIINVQASFYDDKVSLKPLVPHITIVQPNALAQISPLWIKPIIKDIAKDYLALKIQVTGIATFNDKIIYIAIDCPNLNSLQKAIVAKLPKDVHQRYFVGRHPYTPHITVAQSKNKNSLTSANITCYKKALSGVANQQFYVNNISLFKHLSPRQYKIQKI